MFWDPNIYPPFPELASVRGQEGIHIFCQSSGAVMRQTAPSRTGEPAQRLGIFCLCSGGTSPENLGPRRVNLPELMPQALGPTCGFEVPWGACSWARGLWNSQQWQCLHPLGAVTLKWEYSVLSRFEIQSLPAPLCLWLVGG